MRERRRAQEDRRAQEFTAFVAGAAGRLLHASLLLTGEPAAAEKLLTSALARTYAVWDRLHGEDPYARARQEIAARFARTGRRHRRPCGGTLDRLTPQERLVVVLRLFEGVDEAQVAAMLGLPAERIRAVCTRSVAALRSSPAADDAAPGERKPLQEASR